MAKVLLNIGDENENDLDFLEVDKLGGLLCLWTPNGLAVDATMETRSISTPDKIAFLADRLRSYADARLAYEMDP